MSAHILLINGPNLNMLGVREPARYGHSTLAHIEENLSVIANTHNIQLSTFQSNHEGEIIDRLQQALLEKTNFILINPGALTHTSIGLRDALLAIQIPFIEVHISNIFARESFRHHSYLSDIAQGVIMGLGAYSYEAALFAAIQRLTVT